MSVIARNCFTFGCNIIAKRPIHLSSTALVKYTMPEPIDHATGLEKLELLQEAAGNEHPFDMRVYKRTSGELSNPTVVPSNCKSRLIGCICQEDATSVNWMWLTKGEPKRCECGYFFKLVDSKKL